MPLLDLKTDLRSLRFGSPNTAGDRPGSAWSGQPYIVTELGSDFLSPTPDRFAIGTGTDFLLRGGASAFVDATTDAVRLGKMFTDTKTPAGIQFIAKQELLSMTGVNIFAGFRPGLRSLFNKSRLNDGVYLPLSTLLAAGPTGNIIGAHPNKQGTDPTGRSKTLSRPQYLNWTNRTDPDETAISRVDYLTNEFIVAKNNDKTLYSYLGGPQAGSNPSAVRTRINFAKDGTRTGVNNPLYLKNSNMFFGTGGATMDNSLLMRSSDNSYRVTGNIQDFRKEISDRSNIPTTTQILARKRGTLTNAPDYNSRNFEIRVGAGNPGNPLLDRHDYSIGALDPTTKKPNVVNKVNAIYMYKAEAVSQDKPKNDFVKFRFAVINPDNPKEKTFVHFPAFFNGQIQDTMGAKWGEFKYLGRGEDFFNYEGFSRTVSFNFQVVAQSRPELSIMYQKLNYLQSTLAPNFSKQGFMRGNLHQLTIGGYFFEQPGIITTLSYTMPEDSTWEIAIPASSQATSNVGGINYRDEEVKELAHRIDVSVTFKPIHVFLPQTIGSAFSEGENPKGIYGQSAIKQRYIALANSETDSVGNNLYSLGAPYATDHVQANKTFIASGSNKTYNLVEDEIQQEMRRKRLRNSLSVINDSLDNLT